MTLAVSPAWTAVCFGDQQIGPGRPAAAISHPLAIQVINHSVHVNQSSEADTGPAFRDDQTDDLLPFVQLN